MNVAKISFCYMYGGNGDTRSSGNREIKMMDVALFVRPFTCLRGKKLNRVNTVRLHTTWCFTSVSCNVHRQCCWSQISFCLSVLCKIVLEDNLSLPVLDAFVTVKGSDSK